MATVEIEQAELDQLRSDLTKSQAEVARGAEVAKQQEALKTQALKQVEVLQADHANAKDALGRAEAARAEAELLNLKNEVGWQKGVPWIATHRLVGSTREELEADADKYLAEFPKPGQEHDPGVPPPGGVRFVETRAAGDPFSDFLREQLAKNKKP